MCTTVFPSCVSVNFDSFGGQRWHWIPETEGRKGYEPVCGCWDLNSGPLWKQPVTWLLAVSPGLFTESLKRIQFGGKVSTPTFELFKQQPWKILEPLKILLSLFPSQPDFQRDIRMFHSPKRACIFYFCVCIKCWCICHVTCVEVRGQLGRVSSFLPHLHEFQGLNSGLSAESARTTPVARTFLPLSHRSPYNSFDFFCSF